MKSTLSLLFVSMLFLAGCVENSKVKPASSVSINEQFPHPLNPLDADEIKLVKDILLKEGKIDTTYVFYLINLQEPDKATMKAFQPGLDFERKGFASIYDRANNKTYEAV